MRKFLAVLNIVLLLSGIVYFIKLCDLSFKELLLISPEVYLLGICFLFLYIENSILRAILIVPVLYYSGTGIFLYSWNGIDLLMQAMHIVLILDAIYLAVGLILGFHFISFIIGVVLGSVLVFFFRFQQLGFFEKNKDLTKKFLPERISRIYFK